MKTKTNFLNSNIETICAKDDLRPALQCAYFSKGYVYVTDAHILLKQSLSDVHGLDAEQIATLEGKLLHRDDLKALKGHESYKVTEEGIIAYKGNRSTTYHYYGGEEKYPDCDAVIPNLAETKMETDIYGINPDLLQRLTKAMYSDVGINHVKMHFSGQNRACLIENDVALEHQKGLIMPCNVDGI